MPRRSEHRWLGPLVGYTVLVALLILATVPLYHLAEPADRPGVVRLSAAVVLAVALTHLARIVGARLTAQPPSGFDRALEPARAERAVPRHFVEWRDELHWSVERQSYFEHVLWPRLLALAAGSADGTPLPKPAGRRFGRGPSLATLKRLITMLEERA
jgi:hypothetical protein